MQPFRLRVDMPAYAEGTASDGLLCPNQQPALNHQRGVKRFVAD
jgi:hypothetical protein